MPTTSNVAPETLDKIKDQIIANITSSTNDIVAKAVQNAIEDVPKQATNIMTTRTPAVPSFAKPDIGTAHWIWTNEQPYVQPPGGPCAFRKVVVLPSGQSVDAMVIDITCDNCYTLYVNGNVVGNGTNWTVAQRYSIKFPRTNSVLIAVYASNNPIFLVSAGLIASVVMWDSRNNSPRTFEIDTDSGWKTSTSAASSGFERPSYREDSSWGAARLEGPYGMAPWGAVDKPTVASAVTGGFSGLGIADPPSAPLAIPGPDSDGETTF